MVSALVTLLALATAFVVSASVDAGTINSAQPVRVEVLASVPSQCQANCDLVIMCTPLQCCTQTFENQYFTCFQCVGAATNVTDYTQLQADIDALFLQCSTRGFVLARPSAFPGQDPNRPLVTGVPHPFTTSTAVSSATAAPAPTSTPTSAAPNLDTSSIGHIVVVGSMMVGAFLTMM
ncbi:hypothetical protein BD779DRAFT_1539872 [Infundibulicybe gibba]|nr:hypothetical protein BD779DRAFT_1539872 [Infundibulicybe gibba]